MVRKQKQPLREDIKTRMEVVGLYNHLYKNYCYQNFFWQKT